MNHTFKIDPIVMKILIVQIKNVQSDSVEKQAETIIDKDGIKAFTNEQLTWLATTLVGALEIGEIVQDNEDRPYFTISNNEMSLDISGRPPTNGEFRGDTVRRLLHNAQANDQEKNKSVYALFDAAIHILKDNPNFIYAANAVRLNWLKDNLPDHSPDSIVFKIHALRYQRILEAFGNAVLKKPDLDIALHNDGIFSKETQAQLDKLLQDAINNNPEPTFLADPMTLTEIEKFEAQLAHFKEKFTHFNATSAARAAGEKLITELNDAETKLCNGEMTLEAFAECCSSACNKAENSELKEHRGLKQIITNMVMILATLLTAGLAYLATKGIATAIGSDFPKVNTDSVNKIHDMKKTLENMKAAPEDEEERERPHLG